MQAKYDECLRVYLQTEDHSDFFARPDNVSEDSTVRKARRVGQLAEVAASIAGFTMTFKALKYLYYSGEIVNQILAGDLLSALGPIAESLVCWIYPDLVLG